MEYILKDEVYPYEVSIHGSLPLVSIADFFQHAASEHFSKTAVPIKEMLENGHAWFLKKIEWEINELPKNGSDLSLTTWHRGFDRHKGFREYHLGNGEKTFVTAQSEWVYVNIIKRRPVRANPDEFPNFKKVDRTQFSDCIGDWTCDTDFVKDQAHPFHLRFSDFDINGHMNNATTMDIIEDYCYRAKIVPKNIKVWYRSEVPAETQALEMATSKMGDTIKFTIGTNENIATVGEIKF